MCFRWGLRRCLHSLQSHQALDCSLLRQSLQSKTESKSNHPDLDGSTGRGEPSDICPTIETDDGDVGIEQALVTYVPTYQHSLYNVASELPGLDVDYLKRSYPHPRDDHCTLDELSHTYRVHGRVYPCSVSGVVGVFFEEFQQDEMADLCIGIAEQRGLRNVTSSRYNLML